MAMKQWTIMAAVFMAVGIILGLMTGFMVWRRPDVPPSTREADLIADSVRTAVIIEEKDSLLSQYLREKQDLQDRIDRRPSTNTRVTNANRHLRGASVDSLVKLLDRPLSDR